MKTLAIIPAYNEEGSIERTVEELIEKAPFVDFVIVNDGSSDGTRALCIEHGYNMIDLPINMGLSAGFQTGMKYAWRKGYDCTLQFDADGQHDPACIGSMVSKMEESKADIIIGSRFVTEKKQASARMTGSALISAIVRLTTGHKIADPTSGMRLYSKSMIERFAKAYDFGPEPDTIAYLMRHGARVTEVQVNMRERTAGESYLNFAKSLKYMLRTCISILFIQWFR
ncbi:glycosyltransferase family 2 protein [Gordonibacter massiliensis (ex Traore et al. 2017)]|uniref:Glycosyltransferase family 2 protein n=1 Tax=Gordonibacter massiliensis (ex Traore et al. 2017) TaxID=1841863 RepID=A0A842JKK6_9ACTN|nr:glycosyltransferase family 2 protein [Gordonibacter massiliensis (ex Traore et al. 2017)]MBC2890318.1 glycosyltransferase family 2 protein [Gordonibacter massiliensis (ex Traore et al. 2017)]